MKMMLDLKKDTLIVGLDEILLVMQQATSNTKIKYKNKSQIKQ